MPLACLQPSPTPTCLPKEISNVELKAEADWNQPVLLFLWRSYQVEEQRVGDSEGQESEGPAFGRGGAGFPLDEGGLQVGEWWGTGDTLLQTLLQTWEATGWKRGEGCRLQVWEPGLELLSPGRHGSAESEGFRCSPEPGQGPRISPLCQLLGVSLLTVWTACEIWGWMGWNNNWDWVSWKPDRTGALDLSFTWFF